MAVTKHFPYYVFLTSLVAAFLVYRPGLEGTFLFDDFANLDKLGEYNGVRDLDTFKRFILGGIAGPTGRPISLLSFLVNDTHWPSKPYPFKLTNILLHLITGVILFAAMFRLVRLRPDHVDPRLAGWVAGIASASWLLHPFFVSTTLYIVQRMAMLSALFVGLGLLAYIHGRQLLKHNPRRAYRWMNFAVIVCTLLALFSKENGALLPILILVIEWSIISEPKVGLPPLNRHWKWLFLYTPFFGLMTYISSGLMTGSIAGSYSGRSFTLLGRVLTESRIIIDYLYHLIVPQMYTKGLFNSDFEVSKSLVDPLTTLLSVVAIIALLVVSIYAKRRYPFLTLAISFYFIGHVLESTVFPLELYFEHRNYLPAFFLFLPIAQAIVCWPSKKRVSIGIACCWLAVLSFFTAQRASLWGHPNELVLMWAKNSPTSQRAQRSAALTLADSGQPHLAMQVLQQAAKTMPNNLTITLHIFLLACLHGEVSSAFQDKITQEIAESNDPHRYSTRMLFENLMDVTLAGSCHGLSRERLVTILKAAESNPLVKNHQKARFQIDHLLGTVFAHQGMGADAVKHFRRALLDIKEIEPGLVQAGILATHGFFTEALAHLDLTEKFLPKESQFSLKDLLRYANDYPADIRYLRGQIENEKARVVSQSSHDDSDARVN